jgi:flagellar hook-associated protein 3 FlgL
MTRISSGFILNQALFSVQQHLGKVSQLQAQISTGQKLQRPSDDPIGVTQSLRLRQDQNLGERFLQNSTEGLSEMKVAESALSQIVERTQRAIELTTQAANGTLNTTQVAAVNAEIETIINTVMQLGNSDYNGRHVFSGFITDSPPFVATGQDIAYTGSSNASAANYERRIQISLSDTIAINLNGQDILGSVTVTGPQSTSGTGLLKTLRQLTLDLSAGDTTSVRQRIGDLQSNLDGILSQQTILGARTNQLDNLQERLENNKVLRADFISRIQDTNMPEAISQLTYQQNLYEASLSAMSRILSTSIVNFLR